MAELSKTAPRLLRSRPYLHRFVGAADARIDTDSRRPIEGEGNFPPCKALKSHKTRKLLPVLRGKTPRSYAIPNAAAALRPRAYSSIDRPSVSVRFRGPDARWERRKIILPAKR